jgi:signal peptidase II
MSSFVSRYKALFLASVLLMADLISKYYVDKNIPMMNKFYHTYPYGGIGVFKNFLGIEFSITHLTNKGAAWGIFSEYQSSLIVLRVILIAALIFYLAFINKNKEWEIPLVFITVGALGNVIDFFIYGQVVDMFHFNFWTYSFAVFNIADSCVTIGIIWIFLVSTFEKKKDLIS